MERYRVCYGAIKPKYEYFSSLAQAIKYLRKNKNLDEANSNLEENFDGEWDEWLDDDAQSIHDHLYMYGSKSPYLKENKKTDDTFTPGTPASFAGAVSEDEEEDEEDEEEEEVVEEEEAIDDEDEMEDRFMNAIGAGKGPSSGGDDEIEVDEEDLDDEDLDEDLDDEDLDDEDLEKDL